MADIFLAGAPPPPPALGRVEAASIKVDSPIPVANQSVSVSYSSISAITGAPPPSPVSRSPPRWYRRRTEFFFYEKGTGEFG
jgi:hypothetical protein